MCDCIKPGSIACKPTETRIDDTLKIHLKAIH